MTALASFGQPHDQKGRIAMTAFVGSITIGIAAILALANGANESHQKVEEDSSMYPLTEYPRINISSFASGREAALT